MTSVIYRLINNLVYRRANAKSLLNVDNKTSHDLINICTAAVFTAAGYNWE